MFCSFFEHDFHRIISTDRQVQRDHEAKASLIVASEQPLQGKVRASAMLWHSGTYCTESSGIGRAKCHHMGPFCPVTEQVGLTRALQLKR